MTESLLYRNQPIDLHSKLMDWFLYDRDLRHERVNARYKKSQELQHKSYNFRMKPKETKLVTNTIY